MVSSCELCPRKCGVDRKTSRGFCGETETIRVARASLHEWEEPVISGINGSGTVFFSGCVMKCVFCQNFDISQKGFGKEIDPEKLSEIFLSLQDKKAHNINLVNPTHFVPQIMKSLDLIKGKLEIPVVYNSGGYENIETLKLLEGYIDIYLPDLKYFNDEIAVEYSAAPHYFEIASKAVLEMIRQTGNPKIENGIMKNGTIIRHLILPNCYKDSIKIVEWLGKNIKSGQAFLSLMSQYVPFYKANEIKSLSRKLTTFEYKKVLSVVEQTNLDGFIQDKGSAVSDYTPKFDLSGIV